ncbi:MAG TPA: 3-deoxy-8-phosphooctulonate synthase [Deltaproteobacteria bacterium]|nr:3-deoxy-8-phosphooctulonate synthase [Deltaproteobacteria bacterium]
MRIGPVPVGEGAPLVLIAGLNVIESERATLDAAEQLQDLALRLGLPLVFKASFDKANRSSLRSFRGPGLDEGLRILARVKRVTGLPTLTDVHDPEQAKAAAGVVDCLQIPAFLCRQTDLIAACAATGLPINIKKGQFMAPLDMRNAVDKARVLGATGVLVTERGTSFGYNNLVVDLRALPSMRAFVPICFDATHAVQHPGAAGDASDGDRRFVAPLARAAVAVGIDALFVEAHADPDRAPCDGPSQITFDALAELLGEVCRIDAAVRSGGGGESL